MYQAVPKKPKNLEKVNEITPLPLIFKSFSFWHTSRNITILPKHCAYLTFFIMSRSTKKPIMKDNPKGRRALYWRTTRRVINEAIRQHKETLPLEKEIVNDYDYSDYKFFSDRPCDTRK